MALGQVRPNDGTLAESGPHDPPDRPGGGAGPTAGGGREPAGSAAPDGTSAGTGAFSGSCGFGLADVVLMVVLTLALEGTLDAYQQVAIVVSQLVQTTSKVLQVSLSLFV